MSPPLAEQIDGLDSVLRDAGIKFALIFGSRARGDARPDSDLDLAVMPSRHLPLLERSRLAGEVARLVGAPDVDVVVLPEATLELRAKVLREGKLVYSADEPARVAFQVRTFSEFFDFEPTLRMHQERLLRQYAEHGLSRS